MRQREGLSQFRVEVTRDLIDYNDHMGDFAYGIFFSRGVIQLLTELGFGAPYRQAHGATFYAVDKRIRFARECRLGEWLEVETVLVATVGKRISTLGVIRGASGDEVAFCGYSLVLVAQGPDGPSPILPPPEMALRLQRAEWPDYRPDCQASLLQPMRFGDIPATSRS